MNRKSNSKSFFHNILMKISPMYQRINSYEESAKSLELAISNLTVCVKELQVNSIYTNKRISKSFMLVSKRWKENLYLHQQVKNLENIVSPVNSKKCFDLNGKKYNFIEHRRSVTKEYLLTIDKFFAEMRNYIIRTNILIDIGCGIRPETFYEPSVHICIEPFEQYRNIIKPFFPNRSNAIFIKSDAISGLKKFDDNSVDSVFMFDLIEHLTKKDGLLLLKEADRVARTQVVVFTPLGFYPMHFKEPGQKDAWGLDGVDVQEHKSGWLPEDFDNTWDFFICKNCHDAFLPEEKAIGKKYSAIMAIKTKKFDGFPEVDGTPDFVKLLYKDRIDK